MTKLTIVPWQGCDHEEPILALVAASCGHQIFEGPSCTAIYTLKDISNQPTRLPLGAISCVAWGIGKLVSRLVVLEA